MKIVRLYLKHDDRAAINITDENDDDIIDEHGYLPHLNEIIGGDDTVLKIDNETGCIIGWKPITKEKINELFPHLEDTW